MQHGCGVILAFLYVGRDRAGCLQVLSKQRQVKAPRVDSDYAGCVLTRSTTGAHLFHRVNLIKAGSWRRVHEVQVSHSRI